MLSRLKSRGPDGSRIWASGCVSLGQASLATTPEAVVEKLPLNHLESGCSITADARIDNRSELFEKLGLDRSATRLGDGELILHAYLHWGEACPEHLLGDFAFAIWDAPHRRLFCARDAVGMRQLAYCHLPGRAFLFATEAAAVVRHKLAPAELNQRRIADFLDGLEAFDLHDTFYKNVFRLPAAHAMSVNVDAVRTRRFRDFNPPPELRLKSDSDYQDAFLDVFRTATACRLRSPGPVGSMLSGGLDSGAVSAIAAEMLGAQGRGPLPTFSVVGPDAATCPETRAIHAVARIPGLDPHFLCFENMEAYQEDLIRLTRQQSEPFDCYMGLPRLVYLAGQRSGLKVMLDGVASDVVFSAGDQVAALLAAGQLHLAWREAHGHGRFWSSPKRQWKALGRGAFNAWAPDPLLAARRHLAWWLRDRDLPRHEVIASDFATRVDLLGRRRALRQAKFRPQDAEKRQQSRLIGLTALAIGRERYDRVAGAAAIEPRDPFADLRVIDFCLSLPAPLLERDGWPKFVLRTALAGKLPDEVRWRKGRDHLGWPLAQALFRRHYAAPPPDDFEPALRPFVHREWTDLEGLTSGRCRDCQVNIELICLYEWLKSLGGEFSR